MKVITRNEPTDVQLRAPADPLAALASEAKAMDGPAAGVTDADVSDAQEAAKPPTLTNQQCILMAGQIVRDTLCALAKVESPRRTLDDATLGTVADAVAPVLDKHGIQLGTVGGDYMAEIRAAMVVVPVILATRAALRDELAARDLAKAEADKPTPAADVPPLDDKPGGTD